MDFSDVQIKAIETKDSNCIVSAGAGSGKTEVLTQRIYHYAKKDHSLDRFLVLTFTNLAAGEMKSRVRSKLMNDPDTFDLAVEVDNAHIETFDSFSLFLAKKYFYKLGISKDISILDKNVVTIKRKLILDDIFNEKYENHDLNFENVIKNYCVKDDQLIKDYIISILDKGDKKIDSLRFLNSLKNDFFTDKIVDLGIKDFVDEIKTNIKFLRNTLNENGLEDSDDETQILEKLDYIESINDYDELYETLLNESFPSKPNNKTSDGEYRSALSKFFKDNILISKDVKYGNRKEILDNYLLIKPLVVEMITLAIEVEEKLNEYKRNKNSYCFSDISRMTLELLKNENIKEEIKQSLDYIMVDEFQDTNDIQDFVISLISNNNVYMVGDVKQSIYRFRGADCHIFEEKSNQYKDGKGGVEIDLNTSYRSRKEVVDFINDVFSKIMISQNNIIDYSKGHEFIFGQKAYKEDEKYKTEIYNYEYEKSNQALDIEMDIIISDIKRRISNGFEVYDKKEKINRPCSFKDFAIIIDRKTQFDAFRKKFSEYNIPLKIEGKDQLFGTDVSNLIYSLIKMLYYSINSDYESNEYIHAFMSVARSFLIEMKDSELHKIIAKRAYLTAKFAQKIELIKTNIQYKSIKNILEEVYETFDIYGSFSKIGNYYANAHKAEHILSLADSLDALGFSLKDFIDYFEEISEAELDAEFKDNDVREDSVTLINIHASKGLEYGIIYYSMLGKKFNNQEIKTSFLISEKYGLVTPWINGENNIFIRLIKNYEKQQEFEEKIRLLYVALTRAKEKIIILIGNKPTSTVSVKKPNSSSCLKDILYLAGESLNKYNSNYSMDVVSLLETKKTEPVVNKIQLKTIKVEASPIVNKRASKTLELDISEDLLTFGKELHANLENVNFDTRNLDFINSKTMKKYVSNVINSKLFEGVNSSQIRPEFHFFDEKNNVEGFIDALIIKNNEVDIIDFKVKNISEEAYDRQLNVYKDYVSQITDKKIRMFLISAVSGEIREVSDEQ